jgi:hypothetical protein
MVARILWVLLVVFVVQAVAFAQVDPLDTLLQNSLIYLEGRVVAIWNSLFPFFLRFMAPIIGIALIVLVIRMARKG